ncbi:MAG: hypothetical protein ABSE96_21655 [Terracidiphilus sp.]
MRKSLPLVRQGRISSPRTSSDWGARIGKPSTPIPDAVDVRLVQPGKAPLLIPHVTHRTFRPATGTLFLIGERGLTVVRQHSAELAWQRPFVDDQFHD